MKKTIVAATLLLLWIACDRNASDASELDSLRTFLRQHCHSCHGPKKQEGELRFDTLGSDLSDLRTLETWQGILLTDRVLPFLAIIIAVLYVLYGGVATPSEAAGIGALFCLILVAVVYGIFSKSWKFNQMPVIFRDTLKESVMIMLIIGASELFAFALSSLFITQSIAAFIADMDVNRWVLMGVVNLFLLVAGFFLPPVAVILMTAPILLPIITGAGFDPYWFAVILTINMEIGLITPPVGLNLYVINGIAPDITLGQILRGSLPYVVCMILGIITLCLFPQIALLLPELVMGPEL